MLQTLNFGEARRYVGDIFRKLTTEKMAVGLLVFQVRTTDSWTRNGGKGEIYARMVGKKLVLLKTTEPICFNAIQKL